LLTSEDQTLLLRRDSLFVLNLGFHVGDRVVGLDVQGDGFPREGLDKDLHGTSTKAKDKMKCGFFLNVVVRKSSPIFELFTGEDQSLLLWWDSFFVLNLSLDVCDGVVGLYIKRDGFSRKGLDKYLHRHVFYKGF